MTLLFFFLWPNAHAVLHLATIAAPTASDDNGAFERALAATRRRQSKPARAVEYGLMSKFINLWQLCTPGHGCLLGGPLWRHHGSVAMAFVGTESMP